MDDVGIKGMNPDRLPLPIQCLGHLNSSHSGVVAQQPSTYKAISQDIKASTQMLRSYTASFRRVWEGFSIEFFDHHNN